jgi:hypothetical protein
VLLPDPFELPPLLLLDPAEPDDPDPPELLPPLAELLFELFELPSELPELPDDELFVALPKALLTPPVETDATLPAN